jgi:hypothetical protein
LRDDPQSLLARADVLRLEAEDKQFDDWVASDWIRWFSPGRTARRPTTFMKRV